MDMVENFIKSETTGCFYSAHREEEQPNKKGKPTLPDEFVDPTQNK
jgi:hypothetical protein